MLRDKVIVVTGGAGLLGQAFVRRIAKEGAISVAADADGAAADRLARAISSEESGRALGVAMDITDTVSVRGVIARLLDEFGRVDAVVNNAYPRNKQYGRRLEEVTYDDFCDNLSRHVGGYFLVAQQFALAFRKQGHGNIVNMGSIYGVIAPRFGVYEGTTMTMPVEYSAVKSAVIHMTRYFAQYFKAEGIRANSLSPGGVFDHQPQAFVTRYATYCGTKGMLAPDDVVDALVFLLSDASRYMTGQNLVIDDGFSL